MELFDRHNQPISDWRSWTPPKAATKQWRAGRSAMELARAWFTSPVPVVPPEVRALLDSHDLTRDAVIRVGWPELKTPLPLRGEARNHDLVAVGDAGGREILLAVEGKVDETMGPKLGKYWRKSKDDNERSLVCRRIDLLLAAVFGPDASATDEPWRELPYQMLTAVVGTVIEATNRQCPVGVVCIQEFITEAAKHKKLDRNQAAFESFLKALGITDPKPATLYGPFSVVSPEKVENEVQILIGKAQYRWTMR